jgi:hypothetical protein
MKKTALFVSALALLVVGFASQPRMVQAKAMLSMTEAEKTAEIKFDSLKIDLGTFSEKNPVQSCTFTFTNVGDAPLILNQAFASCGCTVPTYTKDPVKPGEKGKIDVTYNGRGKFTGVFTKTITVRSNAKNEIVRLTITGNMTK